MARYLKSRHSVVRGKNVHMKNHAATEVSRALKNGELIPEPCYECTKNGIESCAEDTEAHHCDYSRPLEVVWLCKKHHRAAHGVYFEYYFDDISDEEIEKNKMIEHAQLLIKNSDKWGDNFVRDFITNSLRLDYDEQIKLSGKVNV
jgi:hypothetical protein